MIGEFENCVNTGSTDTLAAEFPAPAPIVVPLE